MIAPLTPEALEELRAVHGKVYTLDFGDEDEPEMIAFKWAPGADMKRFQLAIEKGGDGAQMRATRDLFDAVMLHPSRGPELDKLVAEYALAPTAVVDETIKLQRGMAPDRAKKARPAKSGQ